MPAVTGAQIISDAYALLNVYIPGESVSANDGALALRFLNDLLSEWSQRALFIPIIARERFAMIADKGGPDDPYTIGPGGDWDTERPENQSSISSANLILTNTSPEVRVPLGIYTDDAYDANALPAMSNAQPTGLYYNPTYANDLGSVYLWPVPNVAYNAIELFLSKAVAQFATAIATYDVPAGLPRALKYNLALALTAPTGRTLSEDVKAIAKSSLGTFKRSNTKLSDLMSDVGFASNRQNIFNIQTGQ